MPSALDLACARGLACDLVRDLDLAIAIASALYRASDRALALALDRALASDRALDFALASASASASVRDLYRALASDLDRALAIASASASDLDRALASARANAIAIVDMLTAQTVQTNPPALAHLLLEFMAPAEWSESTANDFFEQYERKFRRVHDKHGLRMSQLDYSWQVLRSAPGMLKIHFRNLVAWVGALAGAAKLFDIVHRYWSTK